MFYYEFPCNSPAGRRLERFHHACMEAERKAEVYAKRMGAHSYYFNPNFFAGGVSYLVFKDPEKVNTDVWRVVHKTEEGELWWEPNVSISVGCVKARDNFTPSDVAGRTYQKQPCGWDDVRQLYTLNEWLAFIGFHSSGDKEIDAQTVVGILKEKRFYKFIEITPLAAPPVGRKRSRDGSKAIQAEQMRMKLPTVRTDDFYKIMGADTSGEDAGKNREASTPVFFKYNEKWFVGMEFPISQEGFDGGQFEIITQGKYVAMKNTMLREMQNRK